MNAEQVKAAIEKVRTPLAKMLEGLSEADPHVRQSVRTAVAHLDEATRLVPADPEPEVEEAPAEEPKKPRAKSAPAEANEPAKPE